MRSHYRLSETLNTAGLYVYTPLRASGSKPRCSVASLDYWG
jgi:hypothetical protein